MLYISITAKVRVKISLDIRNLGGQICVLIELVKSYFFYSSEINYDQLAVIIVEENDNNKCIIISIRDDNNKRKIFEEVTRRKYMRKK